MSVLLKLDQESTLCFKIVKFLYFELISNHFTLKFIGTDQCTAVAMGDMEATGAMEVMAATEATEVCTAQACKEAMVSISSPSDKLHK